MTDQEIKSIEDLLKDVNLLRVVYQHAHKTFVNTSSKVDKPEHFMTYCITQSLLAELYRQGYQLTKKE